jgi:hypothetical protein
MDAFDSRVWHRQRKEHFGLRYLNARDISRFEGCEGLGSDLVILETHERDGLLGRERSTYIRVRDPEGSATLVGNRITNVEPVLGAVNLFNVDHYAAVGNLLRVMGDILNPHHCLRKNQRRDFANLRVRRLGRGLRVEMLFWRGRCADQYIHGRKLARGVEFIAHFARCSPDEEIGGNSFAERLHKDLVVMPLDLKAVGIGDGERGHGLAEFENGEMVQRGFNMADAADRPDMRACDHSPQFVQRARPESPGDCNDAAFSWTGWCSPPRSLEGRTPRASRTVDSHVL